jgi:hypothetical protein
MKVEISFNSGNTWTNIRRLGSTVANLITAVDRNPKDVKRVLSDALYQQCRDRLLKCMLEAQISYKYLTLMLIIDTSLPRWIHQRYVWCVTYVSKILTQLSSCLASISNSARMHNDTRDWQAYRTWFLNSVLVFSSAKRINRMRMYGANICARIQRKLRSSRCASYLHFVPIKPIASRIRLISNLPITEFKIRSHFKSGF